MAVGHFTLESGEVNTGITAVLPHRENIFREKVYAGSHVFNGFGKSLGLIQIEELGTIETPILLTNTLSVGAVADGLISYMLKLDPAIADTTGTVNPLILECNDGYLNDIRALALTKRTFIRRSKRRGATLNREPSAPGRGCVAWGLREVSAPLPALLKSRGNLIRSACWLIQLSRRKLSKSENKGPECRRVVDGRRRRFGRPRLDYRRYRD